MRFLRLILVVLLLVSCNTSGEKADVDKWKKEIIQTEEDFARMADEKGIPEAFLFYADEDAVLLRGDKLIKGKKGIAENYKERKNNNNVSLSWKPSFVEVSAAGDLGYTYGEYKYTVIDSAGEKKTSIGIFHTVWKRQEDGSWKYVWD